MEKIDRVRIHEVGSRRLGRMTGGGGQQGQDFRGRQKER